MKQRKWHQPPPERSWARSLRLRALLAVLAALLAPLIWVWGQGLAEAGVAYDMRRDNTAAANRAVAVLTGQSDEALEDIAASKKVRLRILEPGGEVDVDIDRVPVSGLSDPFLYGPTGRPILWTVDERLPKLPARPEIAEARTRGHARRCTVRARGLLLICHEARSVPGADGVRILHVQAARGRAIRGLYDVRYQLTGLTLLMLAAVIGIGIWLGGRIVGPIERLREQMMARTEAPLSTEPITERRDDEFADLAHAFNQVLGALDARNKSNVSFAADLAHEMKNPLAAIRAAADALERPMDPARAQRLRRILSDSTDRLNVVVSQFLELARAEAGLSDDERQVVAFDAMLAALIDALRVDERFRSIAFELEAESCSAWVAPERIETALRNLLVNAASFAGESGRVRVRVGPEAAGVVVSIGDSGPGIPADQIDQVFDRYFTTRAEGTGLGLPMARAVIEAHGGTITATSPPGEGATFTVRLPTGRHEET